MKKLILPLVALVLMGFAVLHVVRAHQDKTPLGPPVEPARSPYNQTIAGAGIVEASSENIAVGTHVPGVVVEVFVKVGDTVKPGDRLFRLDDRALQAEKRFREAALASAKAQLHRLKQMPRVEEVPPLEARVDEAKANYVDQEDQVKRARALYERRAIGEEELVRREQAFRMAAQQLKYAEAELALLKAGAWQQDLDVSTRALEQAEAQLQQTRTELDRLEVRALVPGEVLQVNVRPGEYVGTPPSQALVVLGDVSAKHVRVDIDENDIPRFRTSGIAQASPRGDAQTKYQLTYVRTEKYVIPKKSLTGETKERVDTRVLQVIYRLEKHPGSGPGAKGATVVEPFVGQQMDVFIECR